MRLLSITCAVHLLALPLPAADLKIDANFPGGSIKVEKIDQENRIIAFAPAAHVDRGWDCWWYFKAEGITPGETITLDLNGTGFASPDRATFSIDHKTWKHTEPGKRDKSRNVFKQKIDAKEAWFAWGPPLVLKDAQDWIDSIVKSKPYVKPFELCRSTDDRPVPAIKIEDEGVPTKDRLGIWFNARQHAWESGGSWVGKGLIEWILSDDERALALRKKAIVYYVPIMDVDNVERGAGGKNQKPHDHNRDWLAKPVFPAVRAAQKYITEMNDAGRFDMFIDLHNPGPGDKQPFFFVAPPELLKNEERNNLQMFLDSAKLEMTGPMKIAAQPRMSGPSYDKAWMDISKNWVTANTKKHAVAMTLETSWNTPNSTTEGYQRVGKELGLAVERYFRESRR